MNRNSLNRNGLLVLGLVFGLFSTSAGQCEFNQKSGLNGSEQESNSDRGPSNSSGSSGGDSDRKGEIERGIETVKEALEAMRRSVNKYRQDSWDTKSFCQRDLLYYKECRSLFSKLDPSPWRIPSQSLTFSSSPLEKLCYYVSQGNTPMMLTILGRLDYCDAQYIRGYDAEKTIEDLAQDYSKILANNNTPDFIEKTQEFRSSLIRFSQVVEYFNSQDTPLCPWEPDNYMDQLIDHLDNIQSGLVKIFGWKLSYFNDEKRQVFERNMGALYQQLVDFFLYTNSPINYSCLAQANYQDMISFAKDLPDYLEQAN